MKEQTSIKQQTAIQLRKVQFPDIHLRNNKLYISQEKQEEVDYELTYKILFNKTNKKKFLIRFDLKLNSLEVKERIQNVVMTAFFESEKELDEEAKNSDFIQLNSPAIAFPYLRSFVTTLTTLAGYIPVTLPTINLSRLKSE